MIHNGFYRPAHGSWGHASWDHGQGHATWGHGTTWGYHPGFAAGTVTGLAVGAAASPGPYPVYTPYPYSYPYPVYTPYPYPYPVSY